MESTQAYSAEVDVQLLQMPYAEDKPEKMKHEKGTLGQKEYTVASSQSAQMKLVQTPPRVTRLLKLIASPQIDADYDLTRGEKAILAKGLQQLKKMSPRRKDKRKGLCRRVHRAVLHKLDPSQAGKPDNSPGKHKGIARRLSQSEWPGRTMEDLRRTFMASPDADKERWSPRYLHLDHITKYTEGEGGLHLCDPTSPDWAYLKHRTTLTFNGVYGAQILPPGGAAKFSSFWPLGTTERDLVEMQESSEVLTKEGNAELLRVPMKAGPPVNAIRYIRQGYISSFYPLFSILHISNKADALITFNFEQHDNPIKDHFTGVMTSQIFTELAKGKIEPIFEDVEKDLIYVDCTTILHGLGLPVMFEKGFVFSIAGSEVGHVYYREPVAKAEAMDAEGGGDEARSADALRASPVHRGAPIACAISQKMQAASYFSQPAFSPHSIPDMGRVGMTPRQLDLDDDDDDDGGIVFGDLDEDDDDDGITFGVQGSLDAES